MEKLNSKKVIQYITRVAIFGALSIILYVVPGLQFGVPFAPTFLKIHLDEIPVLLAGFAYGWQTSLAIILLKSVIKLIQDIPTTMGVGVLADIIYGCALCIPAALFYSKKRTILGAIYGVLIGFLCNLIFSCVIGLYTIFPLYGLIYGRNVVTGMFQAFDPSIVDLSDIKIAYEFLLPFNSIKNGIVVLSTFIIYKPMRIIIERIKK